MKTLSTIALAAAFTVAVAGAAFSGTNAGGAKTASAANTATIEKLQVAADQALADGRNGNKNNIEFRRKNYEINQIIERLKKGEKVDPAQVDQALEPAHVW